MKRRFKRVLTTFLVCAMLAASAAAEEITVAAASDLQFALREIAQNYEKKTGNTVKLAFGSSGALAAQIQNGAPFDVFFSADASYPETLVKNGAADGKTLIRYARGVLVVWAAGPPTIGGIAGVEEPWVRALQSPTVQKIAIANPQHAPYGRAAVQAMRGSGVYNRIREKIVVGENVSQAAQFAESGNAQVALLPLSLVLVGPLKAKGQYVQVPEHFHSAIIQAAVVTKQARDASAAAGFLRYVLSTEGILTLRKYGFVAEDLNSKAAMP